MRTILAIFLSATLLTFGAAPAVAGSCSGIRFSNEIEVGGTTLVLNGLGMREVTVFSVDVYVAALYVVERSSSGTRLAGSETPRRLILRFVRDVDGEDIQEAFEDGFENTGGGVSGLAGKIRELNGYMRDVEDGDRLVFTYIPGEGLHVQRGSTERGVIEGADFAEAFFLIWLGSDPPNAGLKSGLLGGSCG